MVICSLRSCGEGLFHSCWSHQLYLKREDYTEEIAMLEMLVVDEEDGPSAAPPPGYMRSTMSVPGPCAR